MKNLCINRWDGGISDDIYFGPEGSFANLQNLDPRRKLGCISLSAAPSTVFTTDGLITANASMFRFTDRGKIYDDGGTLRYTMLSYPTTIYNAIFFANYYYWVTSGKLHRISLSDSYSQNPWTSVTENYKTIGSSTITYPMLNMYDKVLYIGTGNSLTRMDASGNIMEALSFDGTITGMTYSGSYIKVYVDDAVGTKIYFVQPIQEEVISAITWPNLDVRSVYNDQTMDYALIGTNSNMKNSALAMASGYGTNILKKAISRDNLFNFIGNVNTGEQGSMSKFQDMLFLPTKQGIYTYGSFYPNMEGIFNLDYALTNDSIGIMKTYSHELYFSYKSGSNYYLSKVELSESISSFASSGEFITRIYNGGSFCTNKKIHSMSLGFEKLNPGEKLQIYIKKNGTTDWGNPVASVDYANMSDRDVYTKTFIGPDMDVGNWNYIQIKGVLTAGTGGATSPKLYEIDLQWEDTKCLL